MTSSYNNNNINFGDLFSTITFIQQPKKIIEIGILNGFSLSNFINNSSENTQIYAYDIFQNFNGNHAIKDDILNRFNQDNVIIEEKNFFDVYKEHDNNSIDILHIDIANDGDTYEFVFQNYIKKMTSGGIIILEGGSEQRDNIEWMIKYKKPKIQPVINKYKKIYDIKTFTAFPSITIIKL